MTVLVVAVLAVAMAGLTAAATSMVTARAEQLRRGRSDDIQRMLDAGRQWVEAGGLSESTPNSDAITLELPSFAQETDASPTTAVVKQLEIQAEADNEIRVTASVQRIRGDTILVLATRTIRFSFDPADTTSDSSNESPQPNASDTEPVDADGPDFNGENEQ